MVRPKLINQGSPDGEYSKETIQNSGFPSLSLKSPLLGVHPIMIRRRTDFTFGRKGFEKLTTLNPSSDSANRPSRTRNNGTSVSFSNSNRPIFIYTLLYRDG